MSEPTASEDNVDDVQNDQVIESALRKSLIFVIVLLLPVIGLLAFLNLRKTDEEVVEVEMEAPEGRVIDEQRLPSVPLTDVTQESGISFRHHAGKRGEKLLPETMGSGCAVFDYDNDGNQDLFFVNSSDWPWSEDRKIGRCSLYRGNGQFQFEDVSAQVGLDLELYGMGVAVGDYDNDGDKDLFITAVGRNRMLRNDNGMFVDVTESSGLGGDSESWSTSAGFFDYDNDGKLDLFVCNYVTWSRELDLSQTFSIDG
ncbi:MAG: VCBS repeat-containing protein [Planctomycetota bacterium]